MGFHQLLRLPPRGVAPGRIVGYGAGHLTEAFKPTLGINFQRGVPNPVELEHAAVLEPRYSSEESLNRR